MEVRQEGQRNRRYPGKARKRGTLTGPLQGPPSSGLYFSMATVAQCMMVSVCS